MEKMKIIIFYCNTLYIGDGLKYRPFHDLRYVPEASRLRE
jgi:hypothetical protein